MHPAQRPTGLGSAGGLAPYAEGSVAYLEPGQMGTIYLLHFIDPKTGKSARYKKAAHYMGWALDLEARIAKHREAGPKSARLLKAILDAGLDFEIVATWAGDRNLERRLKNRGSLVRICPRCAVETV